MRRVVTTAVAKGAKTVLAERLDRVLPRDFVRTTWAWNRLRGRVVHAVELHGSKHRTGDMTVEWGIAPAGWPELMYGETSSTYTSPSCAVIGRLRDFEGSLDKWWDLDVVRVDVPGDMLRLLKVNLLPFFDDMSTPEAILSLVRRGYRTPRRRSDPPLDERGWPWGFLYPRTKFQHRLVAAALLAFTEDADAALAALPEAGEWNRVGEIRQRLAARR